MIDRYDQNLLLGYVEGELSPAERDRFEAALGDDPQLRLLLKQIIADRVALQTLPQEVVPPGLVEDALGQLERRMLLDEQADEPIAVGQDEHARRYSMSKVIAYAGVAAMLALSFGLVFISLTQTSLLNDVAEYAMVSESAEPPADAARKLARIEESPATEAEVADSNASAADAPAQADASPPLALSEQPAAADFQERLGRSQPSDADADPTLSLGMKTLSQLGQIDARPAPTTARAAATTDTNAVESTPGTDLFVENPLARADVFGLTDARAGKAQPQAHIEIDAVDAEQTWEQVRAWARSNQIRIVVEPDPLPASAQLAQRQQSQAQALDTATRDAGYRDDRGNAQLARQRLALWPQGRQAAAVVTQQATLELSDEQMRELVDRLNRDERQAARVQFASLSSDYYFNRDALFAGDGALPRGVRSNIGFDLPHIISNAAQPTYEQMAQSKPAPDGPSEAQPVAAAQPDSSQLGDAPAPPSWSDWSVRLSEQTPWYPTTLSLPSRAPKQTVQIILRSPDAEVFSDELRKEEGAAVETVKPAEPAAEE